MKKSILSVWALLGFLAVSPTAPAQYEVTGDFDGDGVEDRVYFKKIRDDLHYLMVEFGGDNGLYKYRKIRESIGGYRDIRLSKAPPGVYEHVCVKLGFSCVGEFTNITTATDGFRTHQGGVIVLHYWAPSLADKSDFIRHILTD